MYLILFILLGVTGFIALILLARKYPVFFICFTAYSLVLSQSFPIFYINERPINISSDYILIPILFIASVISRLQKKEHKTFPLFVLPYILFSIWAVCSLIMSVFRHGFLENFSALVETSKWFIYTLLILPCLEFISTESQIRLILRHVTIAAILVIVIGYIQWYLLPSRSYGNIVSTFGSLSRQDIYTTKNSFAVYVAMGWLILIALFLRRQNKIGWGLIAAAAFGILVVWSLSRSAVLGMAAGFCWILLKVKMPYYKEFVVTRRFLWIFAGIFLIILIAFVFSASHGFNEHTPIGRIISLFDNPLKSKGAESVAIRKTLFQEGMVALKEQPIFGYGFFSRSIEKPNLVIVDNFYLDVALDTGLPGLFFMIWLIFSLIAFAWKVRNIAMRTNYTLIGAWAWGFGGALVCLFTASISASIPYLGRILGTIVIILACLARWGKNSVS